MAEALKELYSEALIRELCEALKEEYAPFEVEGFTASIFDEAWSERALKERMRHISQTLYVFLPKEYDAALSILSAVAPRFDGFEYMFFPGYVELYGLDKFERSIQALGTFTAYSSSEFAVRPFIQRYGDRMMRQMQRWAESDDHHLRRLASEGCRPRLPWAMALPEFKVDPRPVIEILERLKDDESLYVRRSVANNLNDISKDHPAIVIEIANAWYGESRHRDWIVKHACRTLLKQGDSDVLKLFGFHDPTNILLEHLTIQDVVEIGGRLEFSFVLKSSEQKLGRVRIEYAIEFLKSSGRSSSKVFKISESVQESGEKRVYREHSFKMISTRKYYPGTHGLVIIVNGRALGRRTFEVQQCTTDPV